MTKLLEQALTKVRRLPPDDQDEIARAMLSLAQTDDGEPEPIDPAHLADVRQGFAQAGHRAFASDQDVAAAFDRFEP